MGLFEVHDAGVLTVDMSSRALKQLEKYELMSSKEREEERKWDEEFKRRQVDLIKQQRQSEDRRKKNRAKLEEMSKRWRSLEDRRERKGQEYLDGMASRLSIHNGTRQDAGTPGSVA